ncbi:MAG: DUF4446 family protein [Selenomonadaceae bacterium]|nr:DUF4446 family protein [Selenomonadaceae bacterium]
MDIQALNNMMMNHLFYIVAGLSVLVVILLIILGNFYYNLSYLKKRYRKMMAGADGANLERMLIGHIDETKTVVEENRRIDEENRRIGALLQKAITRVGVVRFSAFEGMGSDLSYAVALLDSDNNGVVLSSIFGRDDSRSYVKPIEAGTSKYKLTQEEEQALKDAVRKG